MAGPSVPVDDDRRACAGERSGSPVVDPLRWCSASDDAARSGRSGAWVRHGLRTGSFVRLRSGIFCDAHVVAAQQHVAHGEARARDPGRMARSRPAWMGESLLGRTAARITGSLRAAVGRHHLAGDPLAGRHRLPGLVLRTATVDPVDIQTDWGMSGASSARTSADVARVLGLAPALVLADAALARGTATVAELDRIAVSMTGWRAQSRLVVSRGMHRGDASHRSSRVPSQCSSTADCHFPTATSGSSGTVSGGGVRPTSCGGRTAWSVRPDGRVKYIDPPAIPRSFSPRRGSARPALEECRFVVVRWTGRRSSVIGPMVIDRIVRQSAVLAMLGVPLLVPGCPDARSASHECAWGAWRCRIVWSTERCGSRGQYDGLSRPIRGDLWSGRGCHVDV